MTRNQPTVFTVQFLMARVAALEAAGDALTKLVPTSTHRGRNAVRVWNLTKDGGKRADRKKD